MGAITMIDIDGDRLKQAIKARRMRYEDVDKKIGFKHAVGHWIRKGKISEQGEKLLAAEIGIGFDEYKKIEAETEPKKEVLPVADKKECVYTAPIMTVDKLVGFFKYLIKSGTIDKNAVIKDVKDVLIYDKENVSLLNGKE